MYKINICFLSLILASCGGGGGDQTTLGENVSNPTNPNENVNAIRRIQMKMLAILLKNL